GTISFDNKGQQAPDVVGALRIDQAWGYAQVSAALHDASGGYYTTAANIGCGAAANCVNGGHPSDKLGFPVGGGFTLDDILGFKGDQFGMMVTYSEGAAGYVRPAGGIAFNQFASGNNVGLGWMTDSVYLNGSNVELTTVWSINGFVQHLWSPRWRTSLYG